MRLQKLILWMLNLGNSISWDWWWHTLTGIMRWIILLHLYSRDATRWSVCSHHVWCHCTDSRSQSSCFGHSSCPFRCLSCHWRHLCSWMWCQWTFPPCPGSGVLSTLGLPLVRFSPSASSSSYPPELCYWLLALFWCSSHSSVLDGLLLVQGVSWPVSKKSTRIALFLPLSIIWSCTQSWRVFWLDALLAEASHVTRRDSSSLQLQKFANYEN